MLKKIVIKKANKKGKGVFAVKNFKKDELILYVDGKVIETEDPKSLPKKFQDTCFALERKGKLHRYITPKAPWKYLNHSCEPNAGIKNNRDIVAMRPIKKGEEICFDYAMNNFDHWTMQCHCGSLKCRKVISTVKVLDKNIRDKYSGYVVDTVREQYYKDLKKK